MFEYSYLSLCDHFIIYFRVVIYTFSSLSFSSVGMVSFGRLVIDANFTDQFVADRC